MSAEKLVQILLTDSRCPRARNLLEASVHRPRRGKIWVASFRDAGRQRWRSTGTTDRKAAMALAQEWERDAGRRGGGPRPPLKALVRVARGSGQPDSGFTQQEVALILRISERAVRAIERRAVEKLRRNPALRALWREWSQGEIEEGSRSATRWQLSRSEIAAVYSLAQTSAEWQVVRRVMALIGSADGEAQ
jgi:hypothetical protein